MHLSSVVNGVNDHRMVPASSCDGEGSVPMAGGGLARPGMFGICRFLKGFLGAHLLVFAAAPVDWTAPASLPTDG